MSVAVLVYAGAHELELGAAISTFFSCGGEGAVRTTARTRASVVGAAGLVTTPEVMFAALEPPEAVFIPGGPGAAKAARDPLVRAFLLAQRAREVPIGASGSGVLILGESGLLPGHDVAVTPELADTVWNYEPAGVQEGGLIEDGTIITAGGGLGALDVALRVAARLWGEPCTLEAARRLGR